MRYGLCRILVHHNYNNMATDPNKPKDKNSYPGQVLYNSKGIPDELRYEMPEQEVNTIPGEALTIREILTKFKTGVAPEVALRAKWLQEEAGFDDVDMEKFNQMDLVEQEFVVERVKGIMETVDEAIGRKQAEEARKLEQVRKQVKQYEKQADQAEEKQEDEE